MVSTVYITKNVYGGDGLGRLGDGRVIFVPGAFAQEQVKAEIIDEKRKFVRGRLVEVVVPSPFRIAEKRPSVPGMVYAQLSYNAELLAKEEQLKDFFIRARLPFNLLPGPRHVGLETNYRNKVVYHFAVSGRAVLIGYQKESSHEIIDMPYDILARNEINAELPKIRDTLTALLTTGPVSVRKDIERKGVLTVRWSRKSGVKWYVGDIDADSVIKETTCKLDFEVPSGGFYQINPEVADQLAKTLQEAFSETGLKKIADLYCGVGVLGLVVAKNASARLVGIESGRKAVAFAKTNASRLGVGDAVFYAGEVRSLLKKAQIGPDTAVVVDPPRGGLEKGVSERLRDSAAPYIFYISCDPATLVRDLRVLAASYEVASVKWFNMFPRTARFETFVVLKKK